ncbi:outer membrane chaperone Skp [Psychromonas sp. CNPT3]|uniref:OmpH family outer membrane protein n=1 Tax=Psychromonas sp. CNPT3 TaxID=314282 RepID=UPI00006E5865|nr:OmpH family outer membrane protein [Psychromonas sp. CNPT3]AGH81978.1 outer membrane chaperone Skp [Psychromonas sp. CNPT3]
MKGLFKVMMLSVAILATSSVFAADAQKIGVVYPSKIMKESPQRARIIKKLESEFKGRYQALQALEKKITKYETTLKRDSELMKPAEVTAIQRKIQVKMSEYKINRKAFEEDNRRRQGEEQQKALIVVRDVINSVAKKGHYDLILNGEQIIFATPAYDISDLVIQEISKK